MGLVFRGMVGVTVSQIFSNHSIVTVKLEEKQLKPWGVFMDKQNHRVSRKRRPKTQKRRPLEKEDLENEDPLDNKDP